MRLIATGLLLVMAIIFVLLRGLRGSHPAWGFAIAFTEAAMVGGLADWFAVTALFRRPLGLPIPHTAIIPENKNRIADTMAVFLRDNFLTPTVVARRMISFNLAGAAGEYLTGSRGSSDARFGEGAANLLAEVMESLDPERLGTQVKAGLVHQLAKLEVSPLIGQLLSAAIADRRHLPVVDSLVRWAGFTIEDNEGLVYDMIRQRANTLLRWTGLDSRVATSVLDGIYKLLAQVLVDRDHPLRGKLEEGLAKVAHDLVHDPALRAKIEAMKNDILANPVLAIWWHGVWERVRNALIDAARDPGSTLAGQLGGALAELGQALRDDPRLQAQLNRFARRTIVGVASRYGDEIVRIVSETVKRWDAATVTDRIESAVGRDLQFIRINGTIVGGLMGVAIHGFELLM
ncbi:MAG: DUF445 domain-containing protein [Novosphingobium sp.]